MTNTSKTSEEESYYLVVDFDNLFFDYRATLVNYLGLLSNTLENTLQSPWNYSSKEKDSEKQLQSPSTDAENPDPSDETPSLDSSLLRLVIQSLVNVDTPSPETVKESLSSSKLVLEMDKHLENKRLNSLCETYNDSSLFCLSVKDGKVTTEKYKTLENLTVKKLNNLPLEVLLLGWHQKDFLQLLKEGCSGTPLGPGTNYYYLTLEPEKYPKKFKLLLVTSFKETVEQFLNLQEFFPEGYNNCKLVDNLENLTKQEVDDLVKNFKLVSSNKEFLNSTTVFRNDKVDLLSNVDLNTLSGPVGSYLVFKNPLKFSSEVRKGFCRGYSLLGIPTANVKASDLPFLLTGVYFGYATLTGNPEVSENTKLHTIVSVGFNPQFLGETRTVEAYLYYNFQQNFYGQTLHLELYGFLRTDSKYTTQENLVAVIQSDLHFHKLLFPLLDNST